MPYICTRHTVPQPPIHHTDAVTDNFIWYSNNLYISSCHWNYNEAILRIVNHIFLFFSLSTKLRYRWLLGLYRSDGSCSKFNRIEVDLKFFSFIIIIIILAYRQAISLLVCHIFHKKNPSILWGCKGTEMCDRFISPSLRPLSYERNLGKTHFIRFARQVWLRGSKDNKGTVLYCPSSSSNSSISHVHVPMYDSMYHSGQASPFMPKRGSQVERYKKI